jgi:hypothetical protein
MRGGVSESEIKVSSSASEREENEEMGRVWIGGRSITGRKGVEGTGSVSRGE